GSLRGFISFHDVMYAFDKFYNIYELPCVSIVQMHFFALNNYCWNKRYMLNEFFASFNHPTSRDVLIIMRSEERRVGKECSNKLLRDDKNTETEKHLL